tara:strand:+ start:292 stop:1143 length:852 start_codon:yes stop_codon:yes gene_type:complete
MASISGQSTSNISGVDGFFTTQGGGGTASTTPTISTSGGTFGAISVTITNHNSYTNPNYSAEAKVGATVTVLDSTITRQLDSSGNHIGDLLTLVDSNATSGERTLTVKAQEFGDFIQSAGATATYTPSNIQNRYLRIRGVTSAGADTSARLAIEDLRFWTAAGGTGTKYPTTNLTSDTSETGIVVSAGHFYSATYAPWKACDSSATSFWWALGTSAANNWWQIEFESGTYPTIPTINSMVIRFDGQTDALYFSIVGSDTGAFSGEETDYGIFEITENITQTFG